MKLVSIIIPVYNREESIIECYNSIIKQTYKNIEIIFVDDGSTDNTLNILNSFTDKRVMVISQENAGPSEARRHGFRESSGEYISFLDSDDTISNDFISKLVYSLEKYNSKICIGRIGLHINYPLIKYLIFKSKKKPEYIDLINNIEYLPVLHQGIVGKLFKREVLELKKIDFRANEDLVIMYPMYGKINDIVINNEAIYHNYYSRNSQRNLLFGYKFDNMYNTFGTLKIVYDEYKKMDKLNQYYAAIEMLFIRNIFERINNISDSLGSSVYRDKFVSILLLYLEYFFPNWDKNKYYLEGFKLGEITDILRIKRAKKIVDNINRKKEKITLEEIYDKYKMLEKVYEENNK